MRAICVDDEKLVLEDTVALLVSMPEISNVKGFCTCGEALHYIESGEKVDVAFLDVQMGDMNGVALARRLKILSPCLNIIFLTGYSQYMKQALDLHVSGYLLKPVTAADVRRELAELRHPVTIPDQGIRMKAFGHFEAFADGKPIVFEREKAKELLALLVDRQGASLSTEQMATVLWENKHYDRSVKNQLTTVIACLQRALREVGAENILVKTWGHLAVDTTKFTCDAYDYRAGKPWAMNQFSGEYMTNYSWAEERVGAFLFKNE